MSTYSPIASITTTSSVADVFFAAIPQSYTDLVLTASGSLSASTAVTLRFNQDTSNSYSISYLYGNGTGSSGVIGSSEGPQAVADVFYWDSTIQNSGVANIMNYSNTTTNKTVISRANGSESIVISYVGLWQKTEAITSITVLTDSGTISAGTTFNLYGIDSTSSAQAKATGGDTVVTDGTYWYHAFLSSGTFTPKEALTCDVLRISGGGGGGYNLSGGGGAGGVVLSSTQSFAASTAYAATVGAGGAGSRSAGVIGTTGSQTSLTGGSLSLPTVYGGGGGQGDYGATFASASTVASGGGAGGYTSTLPGGTTTTGQGNAGGTGVVYVGGGGGGAGGVGGNGVPDTGGSGGVGTTTYSAWGSATATGQNVGGTYYYAGGGGGMGMRVSAGTGAQAGPGGSGGGGAGGRDNSTSGANFSLAVAGTANTGGGGGGGGWDQYVPMPTHAYGANGGSGLVIVRYAV